MICDNLSIGENGHLFFAGKDTVTLAETYGTPLYLIDENKIRENCRLYRRALRENLGERALPLYAGKALCFRQLYAIMREEGMGIDVVSCGEIYTAYIAGFPMEHAFFHGNNKTDADIAFAMEHHVGCFVCDGMEELNAIEAEAAKRGICQKILLRITPGIDPHTHAKISTGRVDSKFGTAIEGGQALALTREALGKAHVSLEGFHCHIGSQIFDRQPFCDAARIMLSFIADVRNALGYEAKMLDLGGGIGVRYTEADPEPDTAAILAEIAATVRAECARLGILIPFLLLEPGRSIVANAGMTLYTVGTYKQIPGIRNYVSVDGGMTDNPRYTLYSAPYTVLNAGKMNREADCVCTIAGRCCESGDILQENVSIPTPTRGDTLAVLTTGAYNYSMASHYNGIPKPPIVMLCGEKETVAVRRETFEDLTLCQN